MGSWNWIIDWYTMTSWHGDPFRVTGLLWGESLVNSPQSPVMQTFYIAFDISLKLLNKQSSCWRFETSWRSRDVTVLTIRENDMFSPFAILITNLRLLWLYRYFTWQPFVIYSQIWTKVIHDDVIKWKHFPRYWPFVRGIHRSRGIHRTKASDAQLWWFLWSAPE